MFKCNLRIVINSSIFQLILFSESNDENKVNIIIIVEVTRFGDMLVA